ncbi:MAG: polyprenyl diphosphate synthase [Sphaerochaeta sp.]|jgi:undecaprenyl diphosphate synthase|nr:di-trans,poly-cis-decaprenylcistransferase [Spirochaetales bacterium]
MPQDSPAPIHLGIIMDGNGRWAKRRALPRTAGHIEGLKALKRVIVEAIAQGIKVVTFYTFSTENWKRSEQEVAYLMHLFVSKLHGELTFYNRHKIRIVARGDIAGLPAQVQDAIAKTEKATEDNDVITAVVAINYGGRDEIARAVNRIQERPITEELITQNMDLPDLPAVDMIVRSANEKRLSNFLLWESAYAELAFYEKLWPDWGAEEIQQVCQEYRQRVRKFGGVE